RQRLGDVEACAERELEEHACLRPGEIAGEERSRLSEIAAAAAAVNRLDPSFDATRADCDDDPGVDRLADAHEHLPVRVASAGALEHDRSGTRCDRGVEETRVAAGVEPDQVDSAEALWHAQRRPPLGPAAEDDALAVDVADRPVPRGRE